MKNKKLVKLREAKHETQKQVASNVGITQGALSLIENGAREASDEVKIKLARYYDVSIEWLFFERQHDRK